MTTTIQSFQGERIPIEISVNVYCRLEALRRYLNLSADDTLRKALFELYCRADESDTTDKLRQFYDEARGHKQ
jgi:hypothetical protein